MYTEQFKNIFRETKQRYKQLENVDVEIRFTKSWFFTMRAVVQMSSLINGKRKYIVYLNLNKQQSIFSQLSKDDLIGWFAHELAHVIDYERMSNLKLAEFTLRYIFDFRFKFSVERRINAFTANSGFAKELFGVWIKFLGMEGFSQKYKRYIIKNYRPDWEDVCEAAKKEGWDKKMYDKFI